MKKIITLLICLSLLAGCSQIDNETLNSKVTAAIIDAISFDVVPYERNNAKKEYYTYYLYTGTSIIESTPTSNTFQIGDEVAVLNLDFAGLNAKKYYLENGENDLILRPIETLEDPCFIKSGTYMDSSDVKKVYRVYINQMNDKIYYIFIQTNEFLFSCFSYAADVEKVCFEMFKLLRTCTVEEDKVIDDYSLIRQEEYTVSAIDIFNNTMPETGYIEDYLDTWRENPAFNLIEPE